MQLDYGKVLEDFFKLVKNIKHPGIRRFVYEGLEMLPGDFWTNPTSSSKRYHPPESNITPFGLLVHNVKATAIAEGLFSFFGVDDSIDKDIIRGAIILHDGFKGGFGEWKGLVAEHGYYAVSMYKDLELDEYIKRKMMKAIETHMSRFARPFSSVAKFIMPEKLQLIVALSDYIASRKDISFYPKVSIMDKEVKGCIEKEKEK